MPWESSRFDACTSWVFLGVKWASPSFRFCSYFISLHDSSFPTLGNFIHTKLHTILMSNISAIKITNPLGFSSNIYQISIKTLDTVATSSKSSFSQKNSKRKRLRGKCKIDVEICRNRTANKDHFFINNILLLRSKRVELTKVR
jgi:hypothetical protein